MNVRLIGSNEILTLYESDIFSIELLSAKQDEEYPNVSSILKTRYLYYLAPHTGCGCGWDILDTDTTMERLSIASVAQLKDLLESSLKHQHRVLLLSTCLGHEDVKPDHTESLSVDEFIDHLTSIRVAFGSNHSKLFQIHH